MAAWPGRAAITKNIVVRGHRYEVQLTSVGAHRLRILDTGRLIATAVKKAAHPWKLEVADVDGDGIPEIVVGVHKKTRNVPIAHNSLYVFRFDGRELVPLWLASTLGRPFDDYELVRKPPERKAMLLTIDRRKDGRRALTSYRWRRFGFSRYKEYASCRSLRFLQVLQGSFIVVCDGKRVKFSCGNL